MVLCFDPSGENLYGSPGGNSEGNLPRNEHGGLGIDRTSFPGVSVYYSGHMPCTFLTFVS